MNRDFYYIKDTNFCYSNMDVRCRSKEKFEHYGILHRIFNLLRDEGFEIVNDPKVSKKIRKDHFYGRRENLEFVASRFPAGFDIDFFQNVVFENPNGGVYDFNKLQKMPYIIRLQWTKYVKKIIYLVNLLEDLEDKTEFPYRLAEDQIKARYVKGWHHEQTDMNFNLSDLDGREQPTYNGLDRDKKVLRNGDVKYFRHWNGYLYRGRIYHNINNMWWVIVDKYTVRNVAAFDLFDLAPQDYRGRQKQPVLPKEYQERRKAIEDTNTKELVNELKRRGLKVV